MERGLSAATSAHGAPYAPRPGDCIGRAVPAVSRRGHGAQNVVPDAVAGRARSSIVIIPLIALLGLAHHGTSIAAEPGAFPSRPVRFILGYPPGGASDAVARVLSQPLSARIGQQIVIDNRPGAGGNIAAELAARAVADGHTWFLGNNAILATNQALYERIPYDALKDFATVALVGTQPSVLVAHPSLPVRSVRELIALAKARPGETQLRIDRHGYSGPSDRRALQESRRREVSTHPVPRRRARSHRSHQRASAFHVRDGRFGHGPHQEQSHARARGDILAAFARIA